MVKEQPNERVYLDSPKRVSASMHGEIKKYGLRHRNLSRLGLGGNIESKRRFSNEFIMRDLTSLGGAVRELGKELLVSSSVLPLIGRRLK